MMVFINSEYVVRDERERKEKVVEEMNPGHIKPLNLKKVTVQDDITACLISCQNTCDKKNQNFKN